MNFDNFKSTSLKLSVFGGNCFFFIHFPSEDLDGLESWCALGRLHVSGISERTSNLEALIVSLAGAHSVYFTILVFIMCE
jgi:hypothetical protein